MKLYWRAAKERVIQGARKRLTYGDQQWVKEPGKAQASKRKENKFLGITDITFYLP